MTTFPFAKSERAEQFCNRIKEALVRFGGLTEESAIAKTQSYWEHLGDIDLEPLVYHEVPYFYAMCILHHPLLGDGLTDWASDRRYWPPPDGWALE